jgi:TrmH family RNA methyltransferase
MIRKVNSHANSLVKHVVKLHSAKNRTIAQEFIAEGLRTISTIINAGHKPTTLFIVEELLAQAQKIAHEDAIVIVAPSVMEKMSTTKSPSGMLATFKIPNQPAPKHLDSGIVLAQVTDPGNAGTLIRTAAAMNKNTVVFVESVDAWNPKVVQASAGAIGRVTIFTLSWNELLQNKNNLTLCALMSAHGKNPSSVDLGNSLIIIGNEGHGIPYEWVKQCDERITLPMPGEFESLNAAVAGSIALYLAATH